MFLEDLLNLIPTQPTPPTFIPYVRNLNRVTNNCSCKPEVDACALFRTREYLNLAFLSVLCRVFPINDRGFPINDRGFPINDRGFPINDRGFPINDRGFQIYLNTVETYLVAKWRRICLGSMEGRTEQVADVNKNIMEINRVKINKMWMQL